MSSQEIQALRQRLEEEQRRREEAERRREEAERQREQAEQQRKQAEQQRKQAEQEREQAKQELKVQTQDSTLPEFLDACHVHLFLGLTIQEGKDSTKGNPANAEHKLCPSKIREWINFPTEQISIWEDLMSTGFVTERHFTPLLALKEFGKEVRNRMLGSELDLSFFERQTVESRVASVIQQLHANSQLRKTFCLNGDITFENHANTLTDESNIAADMSSPSLTQGQGQPRRSGRLAAKRSGANLQPQQPAGNRKATQSRNPRPRADQFCVYNKGEDRKTPAFIIEYKAPHKVSLAHIKAGLQDMDLDEVLRLQEEEPPEDVCRRVIAAVISQTFSYMIHGGLEYGYVCTGEAFIFLRVPHDDPSTVYYYLSVPKEDVGSTTGWIGNPNDDNRLHLTALGQVLAFTLRALRAPTRDIAWTTLAIRNLKTWDMVYDDLLDEIAEKDIPASHFKSPTRSRNEYCRASPVKTRSRTAAATSCDSSQNPTFSGRDDDAGDDFDPNTPSRPPRDSHIRHQPTSSTGSAVEKPQSSSSKGSARQYCTQQCLRGLTTGGKLDRKCPNVLDHGVDRHQLTPTTLIHRLDQQLCNKNLHLNSRLGCESLHIHGSRGALFKITLWSHGYTFIAKGVPIEFVQGSKHEELVYSRLAPIQGVSVPVLLGSLKLRRPFSYDGIADIVHLTFISYAGKAIAGRYDRDRDRLVPQAEKSLQAIHNLHVLQGDPIPSNMVEEGGRVMFIDFERATLQTQRIPLEGAIFNQKRKRPSHEKIPLNCFERERRRMRNGL